MGYRSCIASVIYTWDEDEWPLLKLFVEENFPTGELRECLVPFEGKGKPDRVYRGYKFTCDDVKWYESYPFVQGFNGFADRLKELIDDAKDGREWAYEFIRLGEDVEDIERDGAGSYAYLLDVSREIQFNM